MNAKTMHAFDPVTLIYAGLVDAPEYALEPGVFQEPAHATDIAPPPPVVGHTRHFKDGEWQQWPIIDEALATQEAPTLDQVKATQRNAINRARDNALAQPFQHDGNAYDADPVSLANITGLVTYAGVDPDFEARFITADNDVVTLKADQLIALGGAALAHRQDAYFRAYDLKQTIDAAETVEAVQSVKW